MPKSDYVVIGVAQPPKPREFGPCPKCEGDNIGVAYHDAKPHCKDCGQEDPPSCKYDHCGRKGEHLRVWCFRCQYRWLEDASSGIPPLPPPNPSLMGPRDD
jgi:hypothetical protein